MNARRVIILVVVLGLVSGACGGRREDEAKLRGFLSKAEVRPRTFVYTEAARDRWFEVKGAVADDLRYKLTLASPQGVVIEAIVQDDAIAVRLPNPGLLNTPGVSFGNPATFALLRSGKWVLDPTGAPQLSKSRRNEDPLAPPDPLEVGVRLFRGIRLEMGQASQIKRFNLEDIEYKPSEDPWEYPVEEELEERYDLIRPRLPKREEEVQQGQATITESNFRKISIFAHKAVIERVCEMVDVEGHEEFVKLRERGARNPFLESIKEQIVSGKFPTPVRPRSTYVSVKYPSHVQVKMPATGTKAKLDGFMAGLSEAFRKGLIAPPGPVPSACLRSATDSDPQTS